MAANNKQDRMPYFIYLCEQRILAQNIDGHIIDIGGYQTEEGGISWLLDGNKEQGEGINTEREALDDIAGKIDFLFLDGQFTSLPDLSADYGDKLETASAKQIVLNELSDAPDTRPDAEH